VSVSASKEFLSPSEAAERLGVSAKALRLYERHGLIKPLRTAAGWRNYGASEMARASEIVALRALGLSLAEVGRVLRGNPDALEPALAMHQASLEARIHELTRTIEKIRGVRAALVQGNAPAVSELTRLTRPADVIRAAFDLPWPWGGEKFELRDIRRLNYIIGPLGSGKTRLAHAIARNLPGTDFIGLERLADGGQRAHARMAKDPALKSRVEQIMTWLVEDGAHVSPALVALLVAMQTEAATNLVIDLVEQGLDHATQEALTAYLRHRASDASHASDATRALHASDAPSLFLLTRSSAILDLSAVGPDEALILCPANHSPPTRVAPYPGAPGYEAVATCLAAPEVRARTEGVIAMRPIPPARSPSWPS
jgi:DNA-binding transcriptional MerR regulator